MQINSSKKLTLIEILKELSPDSTNNTLRSWIQMGRVTVDGKSASHSKQIVEPNQCVAVGTKPKFLQRGLKIVYEDEDLVVVEKPPGLLSVATEIEKGLTVHALLKERFNTRKVYPIHRLDRETSGFLVFAYTERARDGLKDQLAKRTMHREYRALVHGHPGSGTWSCFLYEDKRMRVHVCPSDQGKEAVTHFETVKIQGNHSLLKLKLESGRKHQIRVQAAHAGHPVVGDSKYGLPEDEGKNLQLKAVALSFLHPFTKKQMDFRNTD